MLLSLLTTLPSAVFASIHDVVFCVLGSFWPVLPSLLGSGSLSVPVGVPTVVTV